MHTPPFCIWNCCPLAILSVGYQQRRGRAEARGAWLPDEASLLAIGMISRIGPVYDRAGGRLSSDEQRSSVCGE